MKINYKYGICSDCGRESLIVQKALCLCQFCNSKRLTKKYAENRKKKVEKGTKASVPDRFYKMVWAMNDHVCYETGEPLYTYHKALVHHVLHKEDYPELALKLDVCVLLTWQAHSNWHTMAKSDRKDKMPKTWAKYLELCKQYNLEP